MSELPEGFVELAKSHIHSRDCMTGSVRRGWLKFYEAGLAQGRLMAAFNWIEEYSDGGEKCIDCRYSELAFGSGHTCILEEHYECPALPESLVVAADELEDKT